MPLSTPTPLFLVRTARGLSQGELARQIGKDRSTISRLESCETRASAELALQIYEIFEGRITLEQIIFPERHLQKKTKKPSRRATAESVAAHG